MRHHNYTRPGFQTAIIGTLLLLLFPLTSLAAPIDDGVTNLLAATQQGDGSWISTQTRDSHTITEVMRTLQILDTCVANRSTAGGYLSALIIEDTDELSRI